MKRTRRIFVHLFVLVVFLVSAFSLAGCSLFGSDAPELQISGVKFNIDDTKIGELMKTGYSVGEKGKSFTADKKIPKRSITNDFDLYNKEGLLIASIALKNDTQSEESIGECVTDHIKFSFSGDKKGEAAKEYSTQNVYLEGVQLFTAKAADLLPLLEKKFGKENLIVSNFKADYMDGWSSEFREKTKALGIDFTNRVQLILYRGNPSRSENVEWSISFDLETEMANSLNIRKSVPMAEQKINRNILSA